MLSYWIEVLLTALSSSLAMIGQSYATLAFTVLIAAIGFIYLKPRGLKKSKTTLRRPIRQAARYVAAPVLAWLPFFLWALIATPYEFHAKLVMEKQNAENRIKAQLAGPVPCYTSTAFRRRTSRAKNAAAPISSQGYHHIPSSDFGAQVLDIRNGSG